MQIWPRNTEIERSSVNHIVDMINIVMFTIENYSILLGNVVISKKFLRTRKIMVMHSNERGECVHIPS